MKKLKFFCLVFAILIAFQPVLAQTKVGTTAAPFLGIAVGARALGMGSAFVSVADGAGAIFWNPAILQFYLDGIQFALGDLPAPTSPRP